MEKIDCDYFEIDGQYYTTSDVRLNTTKYVLKEKYDALLSDVAKMAEAGLALKDQLHENATKYCCPFPCSIVDDWNKAIASVERKFQEVSSGKD